MKTLARFYPGKGVFVSIGVLRSNLRYCMLLELFWGVFLGASIMVVYYQHYGLHQTDVSIVLTSLTVVRILRQTEAIL